MRKARLGKMAVLCCGVLMAQGAFAAEAPAPAAEEAAAAKPAAAEKKDAAGFLGSVFTKLAPRFGGDANIEYDTRDSKQGDSLTSRVRLTMDAEIDPFIYIHTRLTAKQYITGHESDNGERDSQAAGYENEAIKVGMEQLYLGSKLGPKFNDTEIRVGRQPLWIANGMLADINGINGIYARTSLFGVNALGFFGREGVKALPEHRGGKSHNLGTVELSRSFGPVEVGGTYLKVDEGFWGAHASYTLPFNTKIYGQYVKNISVDHSDDTGYRVQVNYGNAAKQGEWDASLAYLRVENAINPNYKWFVNDGNWVGAKGFRIKAHYALTDWSTIVLVQDFFDNIISGDKQNRTDIEFEVRF